jgi:ParB/RepB/Spo0J family partition protein
VRGGRREEREGSTMDVPAGGEEAFDLEQYRRDCEAEFQQYLDVVGRDTPEGQALLREWEAAKAPIPPPTNADAGQTQLIDLRLLEYSPLHRRTGPSPEEQTSLERSIEANGLRNPIEVRPRGDKFEIISGHRRFEAYETLLDGAKTDSERAKYQAIAAKVRPGASDLDVVRWGIAEDLIRDEFPPADAARSLDLLRNLEPKLSSAQKLSDATGLHPKRIGRYLQLVKAPAVVQEAVRVGMTVDVDADGDEGAHQAQRQLELLSALQFSRLHAALSRKEATGKREDDGDAEKASGSEKPLATEGDGPSPEEEESVADRKTREAIARALKEKWGWREVKRYVDKAIGPLDPTRPKKVGRPGAPFKWNQRRLQVDVERLDALDASQKAELRKVIEQILTRL